MAAPPAPRSSATLVAVVALGLVISPLRAHAQPARAAEAATTEPSADAEPPGDTAPADAATEPDVAAAPDATAPDVAAEPEPDAAGEAAAERPADDAAASDAAAPDAAEPADDAAEPEPGALGPTAAPLRPMQTAAWWTMFGAFALGTTAGVLSGLAERQEDRATRLSTLFDAETGAQPLYADRKDQYEGYLRRGEAQAQAALAVGVIAGAVTVAAITLFAIDARRQRGERAPKAGKRAAFGVGRRGLEVRF